MGEIAADHRVAKVAMGHLVNINLVDAPADLLRQRLVLYGAIIPTDQGDILHRSTHTRQGILVIFGIGEGHSQFFSHPGQHGSGTAKGAQQILSAMLPAAEVGQLNTLFAVIKLAIGGAGKIANGQADQIAGTKLFQLPMSCLGTVAVINFLDQKTVGQNGEATFGAQMKVQGCAYIGQVNSR